MVSICPSRASPTQARVGAVDKGSGAADHEVARARKGEAAGRLDLSSRSRRTVVSAKIAENTNDEFPLARPLLSRA